VRLALRPTDAAGSVLGSVAYCMDRTGIRMKQKGEGEF
jgi:hypothetical protein